MLSIRQFLTSYFFAALLPASVAWAQAEQELVDELFENDWYLPTRDSTARLYITEVGRGQPVITLHGGPGNNHLYLVDAIRHSTSDYTFLLYDQRGSLFSPVADSLYGDLSMASLVDDLERIREATGQEQVVLLGHSFGTALAMAYYIAHPDRVKGLVLTASMPPYMSAERPFSEVLPSIHKRIKALRERPEVHEVLVREGLLHDSLLSPKQQSDKYRITGLASHNMIDLKNWRRFKGGRVFYNRYADGAIGASLAKPYDIRPALRSHPVPVTVIQGDQDYIDPAGQLYWSAIAEGHLNVEVITVPESGHYSWLDEPALFDAALQKGLQRMVR